MKIKTVFRSVNDIAKSIEGLERIKQIYVNRLNGRALRLVDSHSFKNGFRGRFR